MAKWRGEGAVAGDSETGSVCHTSALAKATITSWSLLCCQSSEVKA